MSPLLARARQERAPRIAARVIQGPAVVLGALQRAGRVLDVAACTAASTRVLRRDTTGTAVYVGGRAVLWSLALPHVAALYPDATPRTLLNRNLRGFLRGLGRGAPAHYFGREWIAIGHRPAAIAGYDMAPDGAVLLEVLACIDAPPAIPAHLAAEPERAIDRWRGKAPASLAELSGGALDPDELAEAVIEAVIARAGAPIARASHEGELAIVTDARDPVPAGLALGPLVAAPIGWIEAAANPASGEAWLGGDALLPVFAARAIASAIARGEEPVLPEIPLDGAALADLTAAVRGALGD